jgi:hypothetical protein
MTLEKMIALRIIFTRFLIKHFYSMEPETRGKTSKKLGELVEHKEGAFLP